MKAGFRKKGKGLEYRFSVNGKQYGVTGANQKECLQKAEEKTALLRKGVRLDASRITFREYYDEYNRVRSDVKVATLYSEQVMMRKIMPVIGDMKLSSIESSDINRVKAEMMKTLSDHTINVRMGVLKSIFRAAVKERLIPYNPCDAVSRVHRENPDDYTNPRPASIRALTREEQALFFEYAKDCWYYELFAFLISTGCRVGEAGALMWKDIDMAEGVIRFSKTMTKTGPSQWSVGSPKTRNGVRTIPMSPSVRKIIIDQKTKIIDHFGVNYAMPQMPVFRSLHTDRLIVPYITSSAINTILGRIELDHKHIDHFSVHSFRDTFATRFIEQGGDMDTLRDILGHSTIAITMQKYAAVLPDRMRNQICTVDIVV